MTGASVQLPARFSELQRFTGLWAAETTNARIAARSSSDMLAIRAFYDAAVPRLAEALAYCAQFPLLEMPAEAANLYRLMLGLAQATIAVEIHGQPRAPGTPWPNSIVLEQGAVPFG